MVGHGIEPCCLRKEFYVFHPQTMSISPTEICQLRVIRVSTGKKNLLRRIHDFTGRNPTGCVRHAGACLIVSAQTTKPLTPRGECVTLHRDKGQFSSHNENRNARHIAHIGCFVNTIHPRQLQNMHATHLPLQHMPPMQIPHGWQK